MRTLPTRALSMSNLVDGCLAPAIPPRGAGILLHIGSLPGPEGIGTIGGPAHAHLDWLAQAGLNYWQVLPTCEGGTDNSPYASPTSLVGSRWFIDLCDLHSEGLLDTEQLDRALDDHNGPVDLDRVQARKWPALRSAASTLLAQAQHPLHAKWKLWRQENPWIAETALFQALLDEHDDHPWWTWEPPLRDRHAEVLAATHERLRNEIRIREALAFLFDHQWDQLLKAAATRNILLFGDVPIYVAHNSADVWANRTRFELEADGRAAQMAGVPPDSFSETGQIWRNPLYDWKAMAENQYGWWVQRIQRCLQWTPVLRIDHFRGFAAYWAIPGQAETAIEGQWLPGPQLAIFERFREVLGGQWLVAEDLGEIDEPVHLLRQQAGLLCTRVLQFAFETDDENIHLPENCPADATLYTGTHDNDTTAGWWKSLPGPERARALAHLQCDPSDIVSGMIEAALSSAAQVVIVPAQDLLGLGSDARMNVPGSSDGNWTWRMQPEALNAETAVTVRTWVHNSHRLAHE